MKNFNSWKLEDKLKTYSTLAIGVLSAGSLNAQIVYHNVNPDRVLHASETDTMNVDMNSDGTADFIFSLRVYGTGNANIQCNLESAATTSLVLMTQQPNYTQFGYAVALALNAPIAPTDANFHSGVYQAILASIYGAITYGHFGDNGEHFLGVKFTVGANDYLGWIRVTGVPSNGSTVTVMDWAYNSTANTQILAGDGMLVGMPNLQPEDLSIISLDKNIRVNFKSKTEGVVTVLNLIGQQIISTPFNGNKVVMNLEDQVPGIYIVNIQTPNGKITRKVSLN
ncbi:MAG: T9SS type A sorting domain-containing protein [Bacteroidetes bacterium]|nr:T9SS type A sorting domain-containing protein [Bacteroidota bacterium]